MSAHEQFENLRTKRIKLLNDHANTQSLSLLPHIFFTLACNHSISHMRTSNFAKSADIGWLQQLGKPVTSFRAIQDASQLKLNYGKELADVIVDKDYFLKSLKRC